MTRKRTNKERPDAGFRTHPFRSLKGAAAPDRPAAPAKPAPPRTAAETAGDAEELFRQAMRGAKRIDRPEEREVRQAAPRGPAPEPAPADVAPEERFFLEAMRSLGAAPAPSPEEDEDGEDDRGKRSASTRMRRLRKGAIRISRELDLHGFVKDEALRRLEHFVASAAAHGEQAVLVITGKGTNSPGGPVLPAAVAAWLRGPGLRYAAEFHPAPRDRGGSGALVVFLRGR